MIRALIAYLRHVWESYPPPIQLVTDGKPKDEDVSKGGQQQ